MNAQPLEVILARAHKEQRCIRICMDSGIVYQGLLGDTWAYNADAMMLTLNTSVTLVGTCPDEPLHLPLALTMDRIAAVELHQPVQFCTFEPEPGLRCRKIKRHSGRHDYSGRAL